MRIPNYGSIKHEGYDVFDEFDLREDFDKLDEFESADLMGAHGSMGFDADPFFVRRVLPLIGPVQPGQPRPLLLGNRIIGRGTGGRQALRNQLRTPAGIFLAGASRDQAYRWARRQAARLGGQVIADGPHGIGRPHFHIVRNGVRSGHIFWGEPPTGTFFDYDY